MLRMFCPANRAQSQTTTVAEDWSFLMLSPSALGLLPACNATRWRLAVAILLLTASFADLEVATGPPDLGVLSMLPTV